jgi:hypothetical protein
MHKSIIYSLIFALFLFAGLLVWHFSDLLSVAEDAPIPVTAYLPVGDTLTRSNCIFSNLRSYVRMVMPGYYIDFNYDSVPWLRNDSLDDRAVYERRAKRSDIYVRNDRGSPKLLGACTLFVDPTRGRVSRKNFRTRSTSPAGRFMAEANRRLGFKEIDIGKGESFYQLMIGTRWNGVLPIRDFQFITRNGVMRFIYREYWLPDEMIGWFPDQQVVELVDTVLPLNMRNAVEAILRWSQGGKFVQTWEKGISCPPTNAYYCSMTPYTDSVLINSSGAVRWVHDGVYEYASGALGANCSAHCGSLCSGVSKILPGLDLVLNPIIEKATSKYEKMHTVLDGTKKMWHGWFWEYWPGAEFRLQPCPEKIW